MSSPSASQITKRSQVMSVRPNISPPHRITEISGNHGTKGTRKARLRSGCLRRRKMTPSETSTKANSVPMLARSAASPISTSPAGMPTAKQAIHVGQWGVLYFGWTAENNFGKSPSRDMAYQMRAWPYWNTSNDEIIPVRAPITITDRNIGCTPRYFIAEATGASAASPETNVVYFIIPSNTKATPTYSSVQTISDMMMPNGKSFCGLRDSSAAVETESNPM